MDSNESIYNEVFYPKTYAKKTTTRENLGERSLNRLIALVAMVTRTSVNQLRPLHGQTHLLVNPLATRPCHEFLFLGFCMRIRQQILKILDQEDLNQIRVIDPAQEGPLQIIIYYCNSIEPTVLPTLTRTNTDHTTLHVALLNLLIANYSRVLAAYDDQFLYVFFLNRPHCSFLHFNLRRKNQVKDHQIGIKEKKCIPLIYIFANSEKHNTYITREFIFKIHLQIVADETQCNYVNVNPNSFLFLVLMRSCKECDEQRYNGKMKTIVQPGVIK